MKKVSFLVGFIVIAIVCNGQSTSRSLLQQLFVIKMVNKNPKMHLSTLRQVDSIYNTVQQAWKEYIIDSLNNKKLNIPSEALNNIDAYSTFMTYIWATGETNTTKDIQFHIFKNYMLPSLRRDYEFIKSNTTSENIKLMTTPSWINSIIIATRYGNEINTFKEFHSIYTGFKELFKIAGSIDPDTKKYVDGLSRISAEYDYDIKSRNYLADNQPDLAFASFVTGLSVNNYNKRNAINLGKELMLQFNKANEKDKSFSVLNTLVLHTSDDELSRDSLSYWYSYVDPVAGPKLYQILKQKLGGKTFKTNDLTSVNIPVKWNLISNSISEDRLKNTKFIVFDFWYTGCVPCIQEIPDLNKLNEELRTRKDIIFISVNTDYTNGKRDEEVVKAFVKKHKILFPVIYDTKETNLAGTLKLTGYPTKFILTNKGQLISKIDNSNITLETVRQFAKEAN